MIAESEQWMLVFWACVTFLFLAMLTTIEFYGRQPDDTSEPESTDVSAGD